MRSNQPLGGVDDDVANSGRAEADSLRLSALPRFRAARQKEEIVRSGRHEPLRVTQNASVNMPLSRLRDSDAFGALLVLSGAVRVLWCTLIRLEARCALMEDCDDFGAGDAQRCRRRHSS